jgi:hypothetical protein
VQLNPSFELEIYELSGIMTDIAFNPNRNVEEDRLKLTNVKTKQLQMTYAKFLNSFYQVLGIVNYERIIFFYKYPKFSNFCLVASCLFVLSFNAGSFLTYIFALIIILFTLSNPTVASYLDPVWDRVFFDKVNPYYHPEAVKIKTIREDTREKNLNTIKSYAISQDDT